MSVDPRCEVTELRVSDCAHCSHAVYSGPFWDAMYVTTCSDCNQTINQHDRVAWSVDGMEVVHARHRRVGGV